MKDKDLTMWKYFNILKNFALTLAILSILTFSVACSDVEKGDGIENLDSRNPSGSPTPPPKRNTKKKEDLDKLERVLFDKRKIWLKQDQQKLGSFEEHLTDLQNDPNAEAIEIDSQIKEINREKKRLSREKEILDLKEELMRLNKELTSKEIELAKKERNRNSYEQLVQNLIIEFDQSLAEVRQKEQEIERKEREHIKKTLKEIEEGKNQLKQDSINGRVWQETSKDRKTLDEADKKIKEIESLQKKKDKKKEDKKKRLEEYNRPLVNATQTKEVNGTLETYTVENLRVVFGTTNEENHSKDSPTLLYSFEENKIVEIFPSHKIRWSQFGKTKKWDIRFYAIFNLNIMTNSKYADAEMYLYKDLETEKGYRELEKDRKNPQGAKIPIGAIKIETPPPRNLFEEIFTNLKQVPLLGNDESWLDFNKMQKRISIGVDSAQDSGFYWYDFGGELFPNAPKTADKAGKDAPKVAGAKNHVCYSLPRVLLVKTADHGYWAKLIITSIYKGNQENPSQDNQAGYFNFKYTIQRDGSKNFE